jgi:GR25 family glycosyltransferase involved in LPS biosynthesis
MEKLFNYLHEINLIYNNFLYRDINFNEIVFFKNNIESKNIDIVREHVINSNEYKNKEKINQIYNNILNRNIDKNGYLSYIHKINTNELTFDSIKNILYGSPEYINSKLIGIDKIFYINLERSRNRNKNMINLLKNLNVNYERFNAIDGNELDINSINFESDYLKKKFIEFINISNNYEIACTLSHLSLLLKLSVENGEYFLILEDDVNFNNFRYIDFNFKKIINDAPKFDILLLYKTSDIIPLNLYQRWDTEYLGTVGYIINKKCLKNIKDKFDLIDNKFFLKKNIKFSSADKYIYRLFNTFVYKYNLIDTGYDDSTIHPNHLNIHKKSINKNNYELKNM